MANFKAVDKAIYKIIKEYDAVILHGLRSNSAVKSIHAVVSKPGAGKQVIEQALDVVKGSTTGGISTFSLTKSQLLKGYHAYSPIGLVVSGNITESFIQDAYTTISNGIRTTIFPKLARTPQEAIVNRSKRWWNELVVQNPKAIGIYTIPSQFTVPGRPKYTISQIQLWTQEIQKRTNLPIYNLDDLARIPKIQGAYGELNSIDTAAPFGSLFFEHFTSKFILNKFISLARKTLTDTIEITSKKLAGAGGSLTQKTIMEKFGYTPEHALQVVRAGLTNVKAPKKQIKRFIQKGKTSFIVTNPVEYKNYTGAREAAIAHEYMHNILGQMSITDREKLASEVLEALKKRATKSQVGYVHEFVKKEAILAQSTELYQKKGGVSFEETLTGMLSETEYQRALSLSKKKGNIAGDIQSYQTMILDEFTKRIVTNTKSNTIRGIFKGGESFHSPWGGLSTTRRARKPFASKSDALNPIFGLHPGIGGTYKTGTVGSSYLQQYTPWGSKIESLSDFRLYIKELYEKIPSLEPGPIGLKPKGARKIHIVIPFFLDIPKAGSTETFAQRITNLKYTIESIISSGAKSGYDVQINLVEGSKYGSGTKNTVLPKSILNLIDSHTVYHKTGVFPKQLLFELGLKDIVQQYGKDAVTIMHDLDIPVTDPKFFERVVNAIDKGVNIMHNVYKPIYLPPVDDIYGLNNRTVKLINKLMQNKPMTKQEIDDIVNNIYKLTGVVGGVGEAGVTSYMKQTKVKLQHIVNTTTGDIQKDAIEKLKYIDEIYKGWNDWFPGMSWSGKAGSLREAITLTLPMNRWGFEDTSFLLAGNILYKDSTTAVVGPSGMEHELVRQIGDTLHLYHESHFVTPKMANKFFELKKMVNAYIGNMNAPDVEKLVKLLRDDIMPEYMKKIRQTGELPTDIMEEVYKKIFNFDLSKLDDEAIQRFYIWAQREEPSAVYMLPHEFDLKRYAKETGEDVSKIKIGFSLKKEIAKKLSMDASFDIAKTTTIKKIRVDKIKGFHAGIIGAAAAGVIGLIGVASLLISSTQSAKQIATGAAFSGMSEVGIQQAMRPIMTSFASPYQGPARDVMTTAISQVIGSKPSHNPRVGLDAFNNRIGHIACGGPEVNMPVRGSMAHMS